MYIKTLFYSPNRHLLLSLSLTTVISKTISKNNCTFQNTLNFEITLFNLHSFISPKPPQNFGSSNLKTTPTPFKILLPEDKKQSIWSKILYSQLIYLTQTGRKMYRLPSLASYNSWSSFSLKTFLFGKILIYRPHVSFFSDVPKI